MQCIYSSGWGSSNAVFVNIGGLIAPTTGWEDPASPLSSKKK